MNKKYKKIIIVVSIILALLILTNSFYYYFDQKQKSKEIKTQKLECIPFYQEKIGVCDNNNFEIVSVKDLNYCVSDNIYQKKCLPNNTYINNLLLNVFEVNVTKEKESYYIGNVLDEYEIISTNLDLGEYAIIYNSEISNENISKEYFAKKIEDPNYIIENLYLIVKVDQNLLESKELEIVGILPKNTINELRDAFLTSNALSTVIYVISGLMFFVFIFAIMDHIKYIHRHVIYTTYLKNEGDKINHLHDKYSEEEISKYSIYLKQVRDYVHLNKYLGRNKLKHKLEEAGWHDDLIDLVLKNEIPNEQK